MNRIKSLRKFFGYTQEKLASLLYVSRSTVAMWETSTQEPDYETLKKISLIFNVPPDFVLGCGIFENWDMIVSHYDDVVEELRRMIPAGLEMPSFCEDKTLVAWLDTRMYYERDEVQVARWFNFAVSYISVSCEDVNEVNVSIKFTPEFDALIRAELKRDDESGITSVYSLGGATAEKSAARQNIDDALEGMTDEELDFVSAQIALIKKMRRD